MKSAAIRVHVAGANQRGVPNIDVTLVTEKGKRQARTDSDGVALFPREEAPRSGKTRTMMYWGPDQVMMLVRLLVLSTMASSTFAAGPFYLGTWKISSAKVAPWWEDRAHEPSAAEMKGLVGKTITITPKGIVGPRELACTGARYVVKDYPADMLFQGAFDEMRRRDKSASPEKLAATIGFRGSRWKTLETGCSVEIDYHFLDENTAAIGLNNYVYILTKQ